MIQAKQVIRCRPHVRGPFAACALWVCVIFIGAFPPVLASGPEAPPEDLSGFSYYSDHISEGPRSVQVVKVDRSRREFSFHTTLAKGTVYDKSTLSEQLNWLPPEIGRPIAGINGDYYYNDRAYRGDPKGLQIMQGELVSAPCGWSSFWIDAAGNPRMDAVHSQLKAIWPDDSATPIGLNQGRTNDGAVLYTPRLGSSTRTAGGRELVLERIDDRRWLPLRAAQTYTAKVREVRAAGNTSLTFDIMVLSLGPDLLSRTPSVEPGEVVRISTSTSPELDGVTTAIGGGPALVHDSKPVKSSLPRRRHPRSAVGWNDKHMFLVQVDGRQRGYSVGMTPLELANYMIKLGCTHGLNLDGGGSSSFWVLGQVRNRPSKGYERPMANALVLVQNLDERSDPINYASKQCD